jgi:hypothetical protein
MNNHCVWSARTIDRALASGHREYTPHHVVLSLLVLILQDIIRIGRYHFLDQFPGFSAQYQLQLRVIDLLVVPPFDGTVPSILDFVRYAIREPQ